MYYFELYGNSLLPVDTFALKQYYHLRVPVAANLVSFVYISSLHFLNFASINAHHTYLSL